MKKNKFTGFRGDYKITVSFNYSKRTVTIRKYWKGVFFVKYRSHPQSKEDFQSMLHNTVNDWFNYLRYSGDYYIVK